MKAYRVDLLLCTGTACVSSGAFNIQKALEQELKKRGLENEVQIVPTGCNGFCGQGPLMVVRPDGIFYGLLTEKDIPLLVEEHFIKGRPVPKLMYKPPEEKAPIPKLSEIPFFKGQLLIALRNRGIIDPEKIEEAIARGAYQALAKALTEMSPQEVIEEVKRSGLRGRGGAGFPTGVKWERCASQPNSIKYIICNGDEGDPGAYMDRSIFESDPHAVLEGMLIGAYAIGAKEGYIYIRNEYPIALQRVLVALEQAREWGLLGEHIFDTDFSFDIKVVRGAGAFVCGEETALIRSVEGRLGEPRPRPPYPVESGLWGYPTVINNVETWANIPVIILRGSDWFSQIGTKTSKGTKVFSLVGKINNTGLVEVPMGISLREIIFQVGGGIPDGKAFKAVQTGGPSGGCIPASMLDLPIDYESLTEAGSMMGSGGLVVMDESTCMVDVARYFLTFTKDESCGKCTPCRQGTSLMHDTLTKICNGDGTLEDIQILEELAEVIRDTALCGLGKTAPNPVLTTLKYFRHEYLAHVVDHKCPAKVCRPLLTYTIDPETCVTVGHGCGVCRRECPEQAITGEKNTAHVIDQDKCQKCGVCVDVCAFNAVIVE
ncbi:MAG: NADH-quinone oxidoreductase subunit NuoF [bacterium]